MAKYYCDHGAYGLTSNRLGLDTPFWGVPQEGDGTSKDPAMAVAIASIQFTAVPTSGTFSVCGATVSTTGVLNAANVATAANTLATNINATTAAVVTTVSPAAAQLRNFVFARGPSGGAPTGTCQIMMRVGSANLNTAQNANAAIASTFNNSPVLNQFSGGSGGCWGWFINPTAIGVSSSINFADYGTLLYAPYAGSTPTINDTIYVRTGGGASKLIKISSGGFARTHGSFAKNMVFDTNTIWTEDSVNGVLKLQLELTSWNQTVHIRMAPGAYPVSYYALRKGGFEIEALSTVVSGNVTIAHVQGAGMHSIGWKNVVFRDSINYAGMSFLPFRYSGATNSQNNIEVENCSYIVTYPRAQVGDNNGFLPCPGYSISGSHRFVGCDFDFNISSVADPGPLIYLSEYGNSRLDIIDCKFTGYSGLYKLTNALPSSWTTSSVSLNIFVDNCQGIAFPGQYLGLPSSDTNRFYDNRRMVVNALADPFSPGFRYEDTKGVAEWVPNAPTPFPTAGALQSDTGLDWSMRVLWMTLPPLTLAQPFRTPPTRVMYTNTTSGGVIKVPLFIPSSVTGGIIMVVAYKDNNNIIRQQTTNVLQSDNTTWTNSSNYAGYLSKKLEITTEYPIKPNSEVSVHLSFIEKPASGPVVEIYYSPEPVIT